MKILRRYIFSEVLVATLGAMALFCLLLVAGNVLRDLASRLADGRLTFSVFFQLLGLLVPFVFSFSLPLGFLTGVLIGLGRLSSNREVVALKAAGSSIWGISIPVLTLAVMGAGLEFWANNYLAPYCRTKYKTLMVEGLRADPLSFFKTGVLSRDFPGYVFFIQEKEGSELKGFWLWELDDQDRPSLFIRSDEGDIHYDREKDALVLTLKNGVVEQWPQKKNDQDLASVATVYFEEFPVELPLGYSLGASRVKRKLKEHTLPELVGMLKGDLPLPKKASKDPERYKNKIRIQISNNISLAASLFSFALIGVPLAIQTGRKETYANAMLALGLGLVYYFFVSMITSLDIPAHMYPAAMIWLPNIAICGVGLYLMKRVHQH